MSICLADIQTVDRPKQGIIKPGVSAELKLGAFQTNLTIPTQPEHRHAFVAKQIISRVYGDIAADFEAFLKALPAEPAEAERLREEIRTKLRGEGHGQRAHSAPAPGF